MSRGQRPRTPEHFPRMKDRAAGRRRRQAVETFIKLGPGGISTLADQLVEWWRANVIRPIVAALEANAKRSDYALVPAPPSVPLGASRHDLAEVWHDPTHGTIDRDIQDAVARSFPNVPLATRVAIEHTAQDRKDRGLPW